MDDYISRQKLLKDIEQYHLSDGKFQYWVEVQPSADVMPVVRCKNCKYWDESDIHSTVYPNCRCRATVAKIYTDSEFYCAYYERKDGKQ